MSLDVNFNESLTNDVVSFEQLGLVFFFFFFFFFFWLEPHCKQQQQQQQQQKKKKKKNVYFTIKIGNLLPAPLPYFYEGP